MIWAIQSFRAQFVRPYQAPCAVAPLAVGASFYLPILPTKSELCHPISPWGGADPSQRIRVPLRKVFAYRLLGDSPEKFRQRAEKVDENLGIFRRHVPRPLLLDIAVGKWGLVRSSCTWGDHSGEHQKSDFNYVSIKPIERHAGFQPRTWKRATCFAFNLRKGRVRVESWSPSCSVESLLTAPNRYQLAGRDGCWH